VDYEQDSQDDADRCMNRDPPMQPGMSAALGIPLMSLLDNGLESIQDRLCIDGTCIPKHPKPIEAFLQCMDGGSFRRIWRSFCHADAGNISQQEWLDHSRVLLPNLDSIGR